MEKLRVCAYARVSTDKDEQKNSLENQKTYFLNMIATHPDWELAEVFYDEGVSGTSTKKRQGFLRMIDECRMGNIDLILTKDISRFARNTADTLKYTRELSEHNVGVFFINNNIDTREQTGEMMLALMSVIAQGESEEISKKVKFGQTIAMKKGVVFGNNSIYGFDLKNGVLKVNEDEAEVVRLIFHKYINEGKGSHIIARELYEADIAPPRSGKGYWSSTMIHRLLRNEKYAGDLIQKKSITKNVFTHKKIPNDGTEEMIILRNNHEPIVDRDTWDRVQAEHKRRSMPCESKAKYSNRYWCSGKIICSHCSSRFIFRVTKKNWGQYKAWQCSESSKHGRRKKDIRGRETGCNSRMINNNSLLECMRYITKMLGSGIEDIVSEVAVDIEEIKNSEKEPDASETDRLTKMIGDLREKRVKMLDSYFEGGISGEDMKMLRDKYGKELSGLEKKLNELKKKEKIISERIENITDLRTVISQNAVCSEEVYGEITDKITVYDDHLIIKLKNSDLGFKITYSVSGSGKEYKTVIGSCEMVSSENDVQKTASRKQ